MQKTGICFTFVLALIASGLDVSLCDQAIAFQRQQENKKQPAPETLRYIADAANQITVVRPSKIMSSDDYRKLRRNGGQTVDKIVQRISNQYFGLGLAKLESIDSLTFATWVEKQKTYGRMHSLIVLQTLKKHVDGFDMATHGVEQEFEFRDQEFFKLEKPLNRQYEFAWIADDKTIVWGNTKTSLEAAITAGERGLEKAQWYRLWKPFAKKSVSFVVNGLNEQFDHAPNPLKQLKEMQTMVGGVELGFTSKVELIGICPSAAVAAKIEKSSEPAITLAKTMVIQQMEMVSPAEKFLFKSLLRMLKAAKVKASGTTVGLKTSVTFELDSLIEPMDQMFAASKRTEAANNLRQNALGMHNFHSAMGGFPTSVMVHKETGKQYSWRIAILPFIGHKDIHDRYDFSQDWDSPHNLKVTENMPDYFRSDSDDQSTTNTSFFLLTGPDGIFAGEQALSFEAMTDGSSNTILAIEAKRDIHWAKPEDIVVDPEQPFPELGGFHEGGFNVTMADGSVRFLNENIAPDVLRKLFTATGGEVIGDEELNPVRDPQSDDQGQQGQDDQR